MLSVIAVGRIAAPFRAAAEEYVRRLGRFDRVQVIELPDEREPAQLSDRLVEQLKCREGRAILSRLKPQDHVTALCVDAPQMDSETFARRLGRLRDAGRSSVYVIGGSLGLSDEVLARADERLSLSALTLPHQLARVVLLEQIYRAHKILSGERYHK